jgi:ABC-2 type transport system permease protein
VIAVLAVSFLLRGVGDSGARHGLSWLSWLSPIGWAEVVRPFAGQRWWVLALPAVATAAGIAVAYALGSRRDYGAGLIQPRPGSPTAGRWLSGPAGLAWRLQRPSLAGWSAGFLVGGVAVGVVTNGIGQLLGSSSAVEKAIREIGGQAALANAYVAAVMGLFGLVAGAYAISVVLRLRSEETDGRAEPILAGPVSRLRWAGTHVLVVAIGTAALLVAAGLGTGFGYGLAISDLATQLPRLVGAALVQLPAALALAAVAVAAVGLLSRWSVPVGWTALAICGFIAIFGPILKLGHTILDISPFTHVPKLPGGVLTWTPLIWLSIAAVGLTAAGLAGLRRRDIG